MNIKWAGRLLVATLAGMSVCGIFSPNADAQGTGAPGTPSKPSAKPTSPGKAADPNDMELQGSFKINSPAFKGTMQFDGNPLSLIQIPGITPPAAGKTPDQQAMPQSTGASGDPLQQPVNALQPQATGMQPPAMMPGGYPMPPNMVPAAVPPGYPMYGASQAPYGAQGYPTYPAQQQPGMPAYPMYPGAVAPPGAAAPASPTAPAAPAAAAAPAPQMFDPAGIERAARAIGTGVIEALPKAGLPINPALINEGSKMLQTVLSGNAMVPAKPGAPMTSLAPPPSNSGSTFSATHTVESAPPPEASPDTLMSLSDILKGAMYNLEMTQEALYLSTFGDPNMRLTSALEAQRNANEARVAADKAAALAPGAGGQAAEMITATRNAAVRAQAFADQARDAANSGSVVSPQ